MDKMLVILWEMLFSILFLIVLCLWFTRYYYVRYENMRNENWKSFAGTCPERFYFDTIRANVRLSLIHPYIALSRKDKLVGPWKLPIYSYNNFMSHTYFFVNIVCLIDIYFYFCHSLLSSEGSSFLLILLRTVICCILYKNPLIFYQWMTMSDRSRAPLHIYFVIYTIGRGAITYVHWGS